MIIDDSLPAYINDLVNFRKEAGYNQGQFAKRMGIRREHLCMIEKGKTDMSMRLLVKICDDLGIRIKLEKA